MRIYFATWLFDKTLGESLTKKQAFSRLLSFHFIREQGLQNNHLRKYCRTGKFNPSLLKVKK
jgi:hypothetical protein